MSNKSTKVWIGIVTLIALTVLTGCAPGGSGGRAAQLTGGSWPGITVEGETIYLAAGANVFAIEVGSRTAAPIWSFSGDGRVGTLYTPPAVTEDLVIAGDYNGNVYGIDRSNGASVWTFNTGQARFIGSPVVDEARGVVFAGATDGRLHALNLENGEEVWFFSAERDIWSAPLLVDDTLYITSLDGHLYAVNADTGEEFWKFPSNGGADLDEPVLAMLGTPAIFEDVLFFASFNNKLYALDLETRNVLWDYETNNWMYSSPIVDQENELIIGGDLDGNIFALDADTGEEAWVFEARGPIVGQPQVHEYEGQRTLYVASDDSNVYLIDPATGEEVDQPFSFTARFTTRFIIIPTGEADRAIPIFASPVFFGDTLLIAAHQGDTPLYGINSQTFEQEWTCCTPSEN